MGALTLAVDSGHRARPMAPGWTRLASRSLDLARRAEACLRRNLCEPPTITDLCATLGASERTLHEAFREHLDATPKAYLKVLRLRAARHDLLEAREGLRVTDVALDYAFLHFGWFSQDYRRLFGETPHETLQRGRTRAAATGRGGRGESRVPSRDVPLALGA